MDFIEEEKVVVVECELVNEGVFDFFSFEW